MRSSQKFLAFPSSQEHNDGMTYRTWSANLIIAGETLPVNLDQPHNWGGGVLDTCPDLLAETVREALHQAKEWWPLTFDIKIDVYKTTQARGTELDRNYVVEISNKCRGNGLALVARR